jgi:hypothetical protein
MRLVVLALLVPLAGCASSAAVPSNPITVPPSEPRTLAQDAADCGIALALAGVTGGTVAIGAAIATTPACARLPGDVLARLQGDATVKATTARRQMRLRP